MIKVNILNMSGFLETVDRCEGRVFLLAPDKTKTNIARQYFVQDELKEKYRQNGNYLPLSLDFENVKDYLAVVNYYAGDC